MYRTGFRDASVASEVLSSLEWWSIYGSWVTTHPVSDTPRIHLLVFISIRLLGFNLNIHLIVSYAEN